MEIKWFVMMFLGLSGICLSFLCAQPYNEIIDYKIQYFEGISAYNPDNSPVYSIANAKASKNETNPVPIRSSYSRERNDIMDKSMVYVTDPSISEETTIQPDKKYYGYAFADYPAYYNKNQVKAPFSTRKSKIEIEDIKTVISDYNKKNVNFGGHYLLYDIFTVKTVDEAVIGAWEEVNTIIIDTKTGIAYPTPFFGLGNRYCKTGYSNELFENTEFLYQKNSNLLITHECEVDSELEEIFLIKIYKWNGNKFQLLDTKKGRKNNKN